MILVYIYYSIQFRLASIMNTGISNVLFAAFLALERGLLNLFSCNYHDAQKSTG